MYYERMKKKKPSTDVNVNAFEILQAVTGESADPSRNETKPSKKKPAPEKNPAAVALGRLGGIKGGKARAAKLTKKQRSAIASNAARKRWNNKDNKD